MSYCCNFNKSDKSNSHNGNLLQNFYISYTCLCMTPTWFRDYLDRFLKTQFYSKNHIDCNCTAHMFFLDLVWRIGCIYWKCWTILLGDCLGIFVHWMEWHGRLYTLLFCICCIENTWHCLNIHYIWLSKLKKWIYETPRKVDGRNYLAWWGIMSDLVVQKCVEEDEVDWDSSQYHRFFLVPSLLPSPWTLVNCPFEIQMVSWLDFQI